MSSYAMHEFDPSPEFRCGWLEFLGGLCLCSTEQAWREASNLLCARVVDDLTYPSRPPDMLDLAIVALHPSLVRAFGPVEANTIETYLLSHKPFHRLLDGIQFNRSQWRIMVMDREWFTVEGLNEFRSVKHDELFVTGLPEQPKEIWHLDAARVIQRLLAQFLILLEQSQHGSSHSAEARDTAQAAS